MTRTAPNLPDFIERFRAHLAASQKRDEWARKGLELVKAGKIKQAKAAQRKAQYWDARCRKLEPPT